jgi:hypothetical protein
LTLAKRARIPQASQLPAASPAIRKATEGASMKKKGKKDDKGGKKGK